MKTKEQTVYDLNSEKFKYLQRKENAHLHRADINELNKRLNQTKRSNFYSTVLVSVLCLFCLVTLSLISVKF